MSLKQKENAVKEKRTIEATKKNYMGTTGKFGLIAMTLGSPVVRQGTGLFDTIQVEDPYEDFTDCEFEQTASGQEGPKMFQDKIEEGDNSIVHEEGFIFDGLSRGMHLEIKYWHINHKIEVSYRGYEVYKEAGGELFAYAPFPEWEDMIERIYTAAKPKAKELKLLKEVQVGEAIERRKRSFWDRLRTRWGI